MGSVWVRAACGEMVTSVMPTSSEGWRVLVRGRVVRIDDGDGLTVEACGVRHKVRLAGVDVPEAQGADPIGRATCAAAKAWLLDHALNRGVEVIGDPCQGDRDRYRRLIGYVRLTGTWIDLGRRLIELGLARAWRAGEFGRQAEYLAVERLVRQGQRRNNAGEPEGEQKAKSSYSGEERRQNPARGWWRRGEGGCQGTGPAEGPGAVGAAMQAELTSKPGTPSLTSSSSSS